MGLWRQYQDRSSSSSMVGRRGRPPKRKVEELQEEHDGKSKCAKEAKIEAISLDASEPAHITVLALTSDVWRHHRDSEEWSEDQPSSVSVAEKGKGDTRSQGMCWRGNPDIPPSQVVLSCRRVASGEAFDCETQTFHFSHVSTSKVVVVPDSDTPETIKVEIDTDQQEEFVSHPLVCCVKGCDTSSDVDTTSTFYTVPKGREKALWNETLDIVPCEGDLRQHVCSKHFITPAKLLTGKGRVRKKKTCDMLVAEEAEKIRQGLSSGRPKRTPKPNKNYDWAEIVPLIKAEPDELENELFQSTTLEKTGSTAVTPRKHLSFKEDKENKKPFSDTERENLRMNTEEEENLEDEEDDLENISLPSHPRPPPPKPKGRPHRIRDSGTQTESVYRMPGPRQPLREVKVQCNINSEAPSPCSSCSYVNWLRLEELLVDCASRLEGELCVPAVQECLRKVVDSVPHPTHATNVLKLLSGDDRDALENTSDIILVPSQEDEVEIENVIHATVEEPITGMREITPKTWEKKAKWKKALTPVNYVNKEEEEEDLDGLGIQEATEMDDDEFQPSYLEGEETEEDEQALDDEDWTISKSDRDSRSTPKKKPKKTPPQPKVKKGRECPVRETGGREVEVRESGSEDSQDTLGLVDTGVVTSVPKLFVTKNGMLKVQESHVGRQRKTRSANDDRWLRGSFTCPECELVFTTKLKMEQHYQYVHKGVPPWKGSHLCEECGKTFTQKVGLQVHRMHKHGDPKQFPCHLCSYEGVTKAKLARHLKSHTDEKHLTCEVCGVSLKTNDTYKNHMALHTNQGRYKCPVCTKAFHHKQYYDDHYRSHFSLREYNCEICHMRFKTNKSLRNHVRAVHLCDKRMVCPVCGARFMTNYNLRGHMKKHSRPEAPHYRFQCSFCIVKAHTQAELNAHVMQMHPEEYKSLEVKSEALAKTPPSSPRCVTMVPKKVVEERSLLGLQHTGGGGGRAASGCEIIDYGETNAVVQEGCSEAVEGIEAVEVEQQPKHQLTVIYVYDCNKCGSIFSSEGLLAAHQATDHPNHSCD
ncbi:zinc finger protein 184-like isoform X3 [Portunus trituberculatus]|uniref:zinc finger protein 184-like isoform X3 n=1 Tax=Portunus trituberculatus TaxID=210409 RepID=UPI001E1CE6A6|nr:zinc finger protein 184-like isoform X3 [Portunus trituberculatus]